MLRGVADANVLVSALISRRGVCRRLLDAAFDGHWQLVVSQHLLAELQDVLKREKFNRITPDEIERFVAELRTRSLLLPDAPEPWPAVTADPDDDYLVALARSAGVDALISGDTHLTDLTDLVPPVMRPAALLALLDA